MSQPQRLYQVARREPTAKDALDVRLRHIIDELLEVRLELAEMAAPVLPTLAGDRHAYRIDEVAERLGVSYAMVATLIRQGKIRSVRLGRLKLVPAAEMDRLCRVGDE